MRKTIVANEIPVSERRGREGQERMSRREGMKGSGS